MATNIIYNKIFKGLKLILGNRAVVKGDRLPRGAEYIQLSMASMPELIENTGPSISMLYSVNVDLITNRAIKPKYITQAISDIENTLNANPAFTLGSVYYWHDGQILPSEYGEALDENEKQMYAARISWTATHTEIKGS